MDQRWVDLAQTLRDLGLWQHLTDGEATAAQRQVAAQGYPFATFGDEPGDMWFFVDGEAMAEGQVRRELMEMAPSLRTLGVDLLIETVSIPVGAEDGDYVVAINGRRCLVLTPEDWTAKRAWMVATIRPLAVVNDLLAEAGATPRLFTLSPGGNESIAWLLDPRVVAAIAASGLIEDRGVPGLASADRYVRADS
jgi:hypothetical protein